MKRRKFVQSLLVAAPVAPAALAAQQVPAAPPQNAPTATPPPTPPVRQSPRQPVDVAKLDVTQPDLVADTTLKFFSQAQFAALEKLAAILVPPLKGNPGAVDAKAPEFLDFLVGCSPTDRQALYRHGLDELNASAEKKFSKSFAELDAEQAGSLFKPLLVARPWAEEIPPNPMQHFAVQVHQDLRTATMNSREWAASATAPGRRRGFNQGVGLFWSPIDPVVRG